MDLVTGAQVRISVEIVDGETQEAVDPATAKVLVLAPGADTADEYDYAGDPGDTLTKDAGTGLFHVDVDVELAGSHWVRAESVGPKSAAEYLFVVGASNFPAAPAP